MTRMSRERMFALADRIVADLTATESVMIKGDDEKAPPTRDEIDAALSASMTEHRRLHGDLQYRRCGAAASAAISRSREDRPSSRG